MGTRGLFEEDERARIIPVSPCPVEGCVDGSIWPPQSGHIEAILDFGG